MELKPGYKTKVGVIPEDWAVENLGQRVTFRTGPFGTALHKSDYTENGTPIVNPMHIINGHIVPSLAMTVTQEAANTLSEFKLKLSDVVIGRRGDMGRCAVVTKTEVGWLCGTGSLIIRCSDSVLPSFLQLVLSDARAIAAIENASVGSTMVNLNQGVLHGLKIQFPPLPEQRAIAAALSDTDALLSSLDRLLAKKCDIKQAVMQQLLTGKQRLPGFRGEWEREPLGKLVRITKGQQLNRAELSSSTGFPAWNGGIEPSGFTDIWNTPENTITISEGGNSCGFVGFVNQKFWCGGHCYALLDVSASLDKIFLYYLLKSRQQVIMGLRMGSGLPNIQRKYLSELLLSYPSPPEQTAIAAVLSDLDAEIDTLQQRREKTRLIKQGMMQELLTGRTRLV